jgi:hypothetical protein
MILFSLVLQKFINRIVTEYPDLIINSVSLDDGSRVFGFGVWLAELQWWKRESSADGGGGLHSQGIICWWALVMVFKDF